VRLTDAAQSGVYGRSSVSRIERDQILTISTRLISSEPCCEAITIHDFIFQSANSFHLPASRLVDVVWKSTTVDERPYSSPERNIRTSENFVRFSRPTVYSSAWQQHSISSVAKQLINLTEREQIEQERSNEISLKNVKVILHYFLYSRSFVHEFIIPELDSSVSSISSIRQINADKVSR
jgi:hypothetical protein